MEENKTDAKLRKTSTVRVPLEPLEFWKIYRRDNGRQFTSVSRMRSRLISHEIPPDDKAIIKIQKKLSQLSSIQRTVKSGSEVSPPRQLSARRTRGGVTYRPSDKTKSNIIEIPANAACAKCKTVWPGCSARSSCELCEGPKAKFAFGVELKLLEANKASLVIGNKEIAVNLSGLFRSVIAVAVEEESTTDLIFMQEWNEATRVATPSFHLNTETDASYTGNVSFAENVRTADLLAEIDELAKKQAKILENFCEDRTLENCKGVTEGYLKVNKKICAWVPDGFGLVIEKSFHGFSEFLLACVASLMRSICQLRECNVGEKEKDQRSSIRSYCLGRDARKNEGGFKSYSARHN